MKQMLLIGLIVLPVLTGVLLRIAGTKGARTVVHYGGTLVTTAIALKLVWQTDTTGAITGGGHFFYLDSLGAFLVLIVAVVSLTSSLYSPWYIENGHGNAHDQTKRVQMYYFWYHLFVAAMYLVVTVNSFGVMWVAIEATTITSAFLVIVEKTKHAVEAAWKYLILCSVGIAFALFGIILLYSAVTSVDGLGTNRLDWQFLSQQSTALPTHLMLVAFLFILVGYGTKAGLAPLHFWLPDAHSQAPAPASALFSGALLNTALFGVLRVLTLMQHTFATVPVTALLIGFGLFSMLIAFPFLLLQQDMKRFLAFSSVEQMGIVVFAIGLGGKWAYTAALLQMFYHALAKTTLFLASGNYVKHYGSKRFIHMGGALQTLPVTSGVFLFTLLMVVGAPPFALFTSEFSIASAGFANGHAWLTLIFLLLLASLFGATIYQLARFLFVPGKGGKRLYWSDLKASWPLFLPVAILLLCSVYLPQPFAQLVAQAASVISGVKS